MMNVVVYGVCSFMICGDVFVGMVILMLVGWVCVNELLVVLFGYRSNSSVMELGMVSLIWLLFFNVMWRKLMLWLLLVL